MSITKAAMYSGEKSYDVAYSGAFASENNAKLTRTPSSAGNRRTWTYSCWVKKTSVGLINQGLLAAGLQAVNGGDDVIGFRDDDSLHIWADGGTKAGFKSVALYRDVSEFYHIVVSVDTTQTVAADRIKIYVNGNRLDSFSTQLHPPLNYEYVDINNTSTHYIGLSYSNELDGYLAEVNFIDGQALGPNGFAEIGSRTNQWNPKKFTGTYGSNGFYLDFQDDANLGKDSSGNGNHWTNSGVTQSTDTPTGNHCILNSLHSDSSITLSDASLTLTADSTGSWCDAAASFSLPSTGQWYFEAVMSANTSSAVGIANANDGNNIGNSGPSNNVFVIDKNVLYRNNGASYVNGLGGVNSSYGATYTTTSVIGVAIDMDAKTVEFYNDNVSQGVLSSSIDATATYVPVFSSSSSGGFTVRFTDDSWTYAAPSGFKALSSKNIPEPAVRKSGKYFKTFTYTGNGAGLQVGYDVQDIDIYPLSNSSKFAKEDSAYLAKDFNAGDRTKWTYSTWVKRSNVGEAQYLFNCSVDTSNIAYLATRSSYDTFIFIWRQASATSHKIETSAKFIDTAEWYHVVLSFDTTQAIATDRVKMYINGVQPALSADDRSSLAQNSELIINSENSHDIMHFSLTPEYCSGYLAETHFIDGQALTANDFGQKDGNGYWVPKQYTGTYNTNGFHLDFEDNTDLGKDVSGNNNDWTNSGVEQSVDNPSNSYATISDVDGITTISNAGLTVTNSVADYRTSRSTLTAKGNIYAEVYADNTHIGNSRLGSFGLIPVGSDVTGTGGTNYVGGTSIENSIGYHVDGKVYRNSTVEYSGTNGDPGDVIKLAYSEELGKVWFQINSRGWTDGDPETGVGGYDANDGPYMIGVTARNTWTGTLRFSEDSWIDAAPAGFKALSSNNILDEAAFVDSPDLVWIKPRTLDNSHVVYDSTRGEFKSLVSNNTSAELPDVGEGVAEFNRSGFRLAAGNNSFNALNEGYVAWVWNKGLVPGFDIQTYVGNGVSGLTVSHDLGAKPDLMIVKALDNPHSWGVYHKALGATDMLYLDLADGQNTANFHWDNTEPTLTEFTVGLGTVTNSSENYVAYLFAEVEGFSKFGSYTGNGSDDGPFVYCGFRPAYVMIKRTDSTGNWYIHDNTRSPHNVIEARLYADEANTETSGGKKDFVSNGMKIRSTSSGHNTNGGQYIFIAFAEAPFKYSRAR